MEDRTQGGRDLTVGGKMRGLASITRPHLAVMTFTLAAVVGLLATYTGDGGWPVPLEFVAIVGATYMAVVGSYVYNDCCDVDIDELNFPDRALPSSSLSLNEAMAFSGVLYAGSLLLFGLLEPISLPVVAMAIGIVTLYSRVLKRTSPFSFLAVGVSYGLVPLGVWLAFDPHISLLPVLFCLMICITDWGFTNSDASRDVVADRKRGAPTFPVTYGIPATTRLITACWTVGFALSLWIWYEADLSHMFALASLALGAWMLSRCYRFVNAPRPEVGGELFLEGSKYRGVLFAVMILDLFLILNGHRMSVHLF